MRPESCPNWKSPGGGSHNALPPEVPRLSHATGWSAKTPAASVNHPPFQRCFAREPLRRLPEADEFPAIRQVAGDQNDANLFTCPPPFVLRRPAHFVLGEGIWPAAASVVRSGGHYTYYLLYLLRRSPAQRLARIDAGLESVAGPRGGRGWSFRWCWLGCVADSGCAAAARQSHWHDATRQRGYLRLHARRHWCALAVPQRTGPALSAAGALLVAAMAGDALSPSAHQVAHHPRGRVLHPCSPQDPPAAGHGCATPARSDGLVLCIMKTS